MSSASALGMPHGIEWKGRRYAASLVKQKIKGQIERAVQEKARREAAEMMKLLPPDKAAVAFDAHAAAMASQRYSFTSERCRELMASPDGAILLAAVALDTDEDTVAEMLLDDAKGQELLLVLKAVIEESFPPNG